MLESRNRVGEFLTADAVEPALRLATLHEVLDATIACVEAYVPRGRIRDDVCLMVLENRSDPTRSPGPPRTTEEA